MNFWQPSGGRGFAVLQPGEPFFFRLKKPHYAIGGFGFFARYQRAPAWLAWDSFAERNGAATFDEMCLRIERYRRGQAPDPRRRYEVGCIMISAPTFFDEADWVREPAGFSRNIVSGAGIDVAAGEGRRILDTCLERARARRVPVAGEAAQLLLDPDLPRFGSPVLVTPRLGQGTFRLAVTDVYRGACAVTGEHSLPVLDVAHIQPFSDGGRHELKNGLLLRTDVHRLFDRGYVTITPDLRFEVSRRLREDYENGRTYYAMQGRNVLVPANEAERPDPALLRWHNEKVFARTAG